MNSCLTAMNYFSYFTLGYVFGAEYFCCKNSGCEKAKR